jgi:L-iditol 2-dehydrogenase
LMERWTVRQARLIEPRKFEVRETALPTPAEDEVLVAVKAAGICGSDLHTYHGANPVISLPVVMGHECAGTIVEAGSATGLQRGLRIALQPDVPCGKCMYCQQGQTHLCNDMRFVGGLSYDGAFADYVLGPATGAVPLPAGVSEEEGVFAEPVAVACHALELVSNAAHEKALVLGAGTIGNLVAQVATLRGAMCVAITDVADAKLRIAREVGVVHTINPARENLVDRVRCIFGSGGPDVTFDCVGLAETINQGLVLTRKAGMIVLVGVPIGELPIKPMELLLTERCLKGCYIYTHKDFLQAIGLLGSGRVKVRPLISRVFSLAEIERAFAFFDDRANAAIKVLIKPEADRRTQ